MSTGHKHRHTGRRPRRSYRSLFAQNGTAGSEDQGTSTGHMGRGMMGGGMMSRGMMAGCSEMMHSMNAASSGLSTQSWPTFSPMPKPCSLPVSSAYRWTILRARPSPNPLHSQLGAHHHG